MSDIGEKLIEETRKVAAEDPYFIYQGRCQYVIGGQPGCIVGKAAWNLGLIDATFEGVAANREGVDTLASELDLDLNSDQEGWLSRAQEWQDNGESWGDSVKYADGIISEPDYYEDDYDE